MENSSDEYAKWVIGSIRSGPEAGTAPIEVDVELQRMYQTEVRYTFQFNRSEDGAGAFYIPGRWGSDADDSIADRDNRAGFEAASAVAKETGTRAETYVKSQEYLNSVSEDSLANLIGRIGEGKVRELLEKEAHDSAVE